MNIYTIKKHFYLAVIILFATNCYAQTDSTKTADLDDLSLKDLLNMKIVSVSKSSELLFDAPLSASVITRDEIFKTGCTSLMEALRLVPGMIVREQTNGNYDIHLRGMDNVPPNAPFEVTSNTTTLVMIDNRPVSSYLRGGTNWEALPIEINDVEKIEVIRGPAAALYGPNAVNGVINIITRQIQKTGIHVIANSRTGSNNTFINNASVGYRPGKKLALIASGNYQHRDRTQTSYYEFYTNRFLENPQYIHNYVGGQQVDVTGKYPDYNLAMDKRAANVFIAYDPEERIKINLSAGIQHSLAQKVISENEITPLSTVSSDTRYADLHASVHGISTQFSYNGGTQATDYESGRKYDFHITGGSIEYNYIKGNLTVKPGISYTNAVYDDRKYSDLINETGLLNGRGQITTTSASIRGEYKLMSNKLRLVAGATANKFNYPDTTYLSYEFAATYKVNKANLLRAVFSRAPRSSNIFDIYAAKTIMFFPIGPQKFYKLTLEVNKNPLLLTADMFEIGYRSHLTQKMNIDVELFDINSKNYNLPIQQKPYSTQRGDDTILITPIKSIVLPMQLRQLGATISFTYSSKKIQFKPFITIQQTKAKNYAPFSNTPDAGTPGAERNNIYSGMGKEEILKSTPAVFGGAFFNYAINPKFNMGMNAYYYSSQIYYHQSNVLFNDGVRGVDHISAKLIVNAHVSYVPVKRLSTFCSVKNILNDKSREFFKTDATSLMLFGGINYTF